MQNNPNRNNLITIIVVVVSLLFMAYALMPDKKASGILSKLSAVHKSPAPEFDWFDNTEASPIHNKEDLSKVWQSKPRCCIAKNDLRKNNREFYKSCYIAMQNYPSNKDITANCLWLMGGALENKEERILLKETFIQKFFYYDKPLDRCANCDHANVSARIARELARYYKSTNRFDEAIKLLERMNDERKQEMSDWVLAELSTQLGKYYLNPEYNGNNFNRIEGNYLSLKESKNNETLGKRYGKPGRFDKLETIYLQLKEAKG